MGADPDRSLAAFKELLEHAQAHREVEAPVTLTDALVGPERGRILRACAIPHEFGRDLLQVLGGWDSKDEANRCYDAFAELSIVQPCARGLSIHDRWRKPLWTWWLRDANLGEFERFSRVLAGYFTGASDPEGGAGAVEALLREHMYHLIGADRPAGIAMFESLCRRARHQWRFTECGALIRLVHDYDPILAPGQTAVLAYHEGKLAADLRDWNRAEALFRSVERNPAASTPLRVNALVRLGHALREQRRIRDAIALLRQAQTMADGAKEAEGLRWRILIELGEAYRDTGDVEDAEATLVRAIDAARVANEPADLAGLFNGLGTVYLKRREAARAIEAFTSSLRELERSGDVFRPGQVQNNLALAHSEQRDWAAAEAAFAASLELKRSAGDVLGQGLALQNLSRVQAAQERLADAVQSAEGAMRIFVAQSDDRRAGVAKHTLGKFARRLGDRERARVLLEEAVALLQKAGDIKAASAARLDLLALRTGVGLPWWAWVSIVVGSLLTAALVALIIWAVVEESTRESGSEAPPAAPAPAGNAPPEQQPPETREPAGR
jgi:tetratricopeptide (TPR) repeat protein